MARWAGKAVVGAVKNTADAAFYTGVGTASVTKTLWKNRHTPLGIAATYGVGAAAATVAFEQGYHEADLSMKLQNTYVDPSAGGTFLRNNFNVRNATLRGAPAYRSHVPDNGATGDLVFALHSLRNGG